MATLDEPAAEVGAASPTASQPPGSQPPGSQGPAVAGPSLSMGQDPDAVARLRKEKARATALLVFAAVVYIVIVIVGDEGWKGYVGAAAEAGMVGALADWFAVTALFRHPLGLPIPHTAIIPKRKDEIGESLGSFIQTNFLQAEILTERIENAGIAGRVADWLEVPENAVQVGDQAATVISGMLDVLNDQEIQDTLHATVHRRIDSIDPAPLLARTIDFALEGGHHRAMFDASLRGVETMLADNRTVMRRQLEKESPWWVPEQLDDRVFEKIYTGISNFIAEINANPSHEVRSHLDERMRLTAEKLRTSPELAARAEEIKQEIINHPEARQWVDNLWLSLKAEIRNAADRPQSELRQRLQSIAVNAGDTLRQDPELQAKVDGWLATIAGQLARESRNEVADLISSTVKRWDAAETSDLIELQIGRDLQFIRINGTLVGGLAGLVIHTVTHVFL